MEKMKSPISPDELRRLLETHRATLIDVRRKADFEADPHLIPGAVWHDPEQVETWSQWLSKDRPVVVYCVKGGSVSQSIADYLDNQQVPTRFVEGGLKAWKESGGSTE
jgi:rhodanese-related sulfurtransferase